MQPPSFIWRLFGRTNQSTLGGLVDPGFFIAAYNAHTQGVAATLPAVLRPKERGYFVVQGGVEIQVIFTLVAPGMAVRADRHRIVDRVGAVLG